MTFYDRADAAKKLLAPLAKYKGKQDTVVVALPRGGVVLGRIIADAFDLPLDIVVPRKIGHPNNEEYAIGAITEIGDAIWNEDERATADQAVLARSIERQQKEAQRRLDVYRKGRGVRNFKNKIILLVDDGVATGLTIRAAIKTLKSLGATHIIVALPGGPQDTIAKLKKDSDVDEVVALEIPEIFYAVGQLYQEFNQVEDEEVIKLMQ